MNIKEKLEEQYERFISEVDAIKSQVDFIEESVVLANVEENSNNFIRALIPHFKSIDEVNHKLDDLVKKLIQSRSELEKQISESKYQDIPECFTSIDSRSNEGEVLQFIFDIIEEGETNYQKIADELRTQIETMCIINAENIDGEIFLELYDNPQKIKKYIDVCNKINNNSKINDLKESIKLIEHHIKLLNLINIKNPINIYRQAFIQLIAVFDTITFEFFQLKFNSNFFEWLKLFKDNSVKYSEIAKYNNFECFQSETINGILKSCYLKDLLIIAKNNFKNTYIVNGKDLYTCFREMINRRNCHIHHNGIVDNAYLGLENSSIEKTNFNIYEVKLNDYLTIDKEYFCKSLDMCKSFLLNFKSL